MVLLLFKPVLEKNSSHMSWNVKVYIDTHDILLAILSLRTFHSIAFFQNDIHFYLLVVVSH